MMLTALLMVFVGIIGIPIVVATLYVFGMFFCLVMEGFE
jgi:hypothetical protein